MILVWWMKMYLFSDQTGYVTIQVEGDPAPTFKFYKVSLNETKKKLWYDYERRNVLCHKILLNRMKFNEFEV